MHCPTVNHAKEDLSRTDDWAVALHVLQSLDDRSDQIDCANSAGEISSTSIGGVSGPSFWHETLPISESHFVAGARDSGTPARSSVRRSQGSKQLLGLVNE